MADELAAKGGDLSESDVEEEEESEDEDQMTPEDRERRRLDKMMEREDAMYEDYCRRAGIEKQVTGNISCWSRGCWV